jgi:hypothetical protein
MNTTAPINQTPVGKESIMNRQYKPTSAAIRAVFLGAATLIVVMMVDSIDALAKHYNATAPVAATAPVVVAGR